MADEMLKEPIVEDMTAGSSGELESEEKIVHEVGKDERQPWGKAFLNAALIILVVLAGVASGYFLRSRKNASSTVGGQSGGVNIVKGKEKEVGVKIDKACAGEAEGKLEANDFTLSQEGTHRLIRKGGPSQTAYLLSSIVDLSQFMGQCVQVWGDTYAGQKAGWLLDVCRVKVLDKCPEGV